MRQSRRMVSALSGLLAAFAFAAGPIAAQSPTADAQGSEVTPRYRYRVLGLYDMRTGAPIEGAEVIDMLSGNSVKTSSTGTASLLFMPDGGGLVRIRKIGYEVQTVMVPISLTDTTPLTMVLNRIVDLPAVVTTATAVHYMSPQLRGFEDRRMNHATGYFIPEELLRKEDALPLGLAILAHIPTIRITDGRSGAMLLQRSPRCGAGGPPDVYLDGIPLIHLPPTPAGGSTPGRTSGAAAIDLSQIETEDIAGVEYYPTTSAAPAQFGGTSTACGVLLLWTREK
jgi:hypothetical protein